MKSMCERHNLGSRARRGFLRFGVLVSGVTLGIGFLLLELGLARQWGWLLVFPLSLASYSMIASLFGACAFSGARGLRHADHGLETVPDSKLRKDLRNRGLLLVSVSVGLALVSTGIYVASS
jgi:hypothetical protein